MCESQVEQFDITSLEALQGYFNIPVKAELTGKAVFGIAGSQEQGEIAIAPHKSTLLNKSGGKVALMLHLHHLSYFEN